jgi:hypothetical protein
MDQGLLIRVRGKTGRVFAQQIDARQFNRQFPRTFPRFVQHAIWRYCSQQGLDICNGNQMTGNAAAIYNVLYTVHVIRRCINQRKCK